MDIKTYNVKEIFNTKIYPMYVTEPQISIVDYMHNMMIDLLEGRYNYEEMLHNLFIGFVENNFIDGHVTRDDDGYLIHYDFQYRDAVKLYKLLVDAIFNLSTTKEMKCGFSRMSEDYNFEVGM